MITITQITKLEKRLRAKPTPNDVAFEDFEKFLRAKDFVLVPSTGGSHVTYRYNGDGCNEKIIIPKPHSTDDGVKQYCIKRVLAIIGDEE